MPIQTYNNTVFYGLCAVNLLLRIEWSISTSMLPLYIHDLGGSPLEVGLVFSVFAGISIFSNTLWGAVSDRVGKRKVFIVGGMAAIVPIFVLMAFQTDRLSLILLRGSTAIFKGAVVPTAWALVADLSPPERVGVNLGVFSAIETAGFAVGPILGGLVADIFGFPTLWLAVAGICLGGVLAFIVLGSDPPTIRSRGRQPFGEALRRSPFARIGVLCLASAISLLGYSLLGPNLNVYLFEELGFNRTTIGSLAFVATGVTTLLQPLIGAYSDRYGRKPFLILGAANLVCGNILLFYSRNLFMVLGAQLLISNFGFFRSIGSAYIADTVPSTEKSMALGFFNSVDSLSRTIGATVGGYVISATSMPTLMSITPAFPAAGIAIVVGLLKESTSQPESQRKGAVPQ
jgi:DHA1 family multidrug resistance protein-like MFS transporter